MHTAALRRNILSIGSGTLAVVAVVLGIVYARPELTRPAPRAGRVVSIVQFIDGAGPYWTVGFAAVGLFVAVGIVARYFSVARGTSLLGMAHTLCVGMHGTFGIAVWLGWALSDPRPTVLAGVLVVPLVVFHLLFALAYTVPPATSSVATSTTGD